MVFDLNGFGSVVQHIAILCLNFLHNITTWLQVRNGDITIFIGAELTIGVANDSTIWSSYLEGYFTERFLGDSIQFLDEQSTQRVIFKGHFLAGTTFYGYCFHSVVQQVACLCFYLNNGVTARGNLIELNLPIAVGGIGSSRVFTAIAALNLECDITQRFFCDGIDLGNDKTAFWSVGKGQCLSISGRHNNSLRGSIQQITIQRFHLSYNIGVRIEFRQGNLPILIGDVETIGRSESFIISHQLTGSSGNFECDTGKGFFCHGIYFLNDEISLWLVEEFQSIGLVVLDLNGFGGIVQHIAILCLDLLHHITAWFQIRNGDIAVFIGAEFTIGVANSGTIWSSHSEGYFTERFLGNSI